MEKFDVVIVGAATTGSYFARRMAERGHTVLIIDKLPEEKVGAKYDIFHIAKADFDRFGLPLPVKGEDFAFEFTGTAAHSAYGRYPKETAGTTIGMHMHAYTLRMNRWAKEAGAVFRYGASFIDFLYEDDRIAGIRYSTESGEESVSARIVADCSGIPSAARTKLPDGYGVENFKITPADMFYVTLHYVKYFNERDYVNKTSTYPFFKTWEAPQADPQGAILGVGANLSFEYGEKIYNEFKTMVQLPEHALTYMERGVTPYRRPPYSFVAGGFVVMGDAACLSKPHAGEGVTSSMVQVDIAVDVIDKVLQKPEYLTRDSLWSINKRYIDGQGKIFASMLATLIGAVSTNAVENDFFFKHDVIFSKKSFESMDAGKPLVFSTGEMIGMVFKMLLGIVTGKLRLKTIQALLDSMKKGDEVTSLYSVFPETADGFQEWVEKADALWLKVGSMADHIKNDHV